MEKSKRFFNIIFIIFFAIAISTPLLFSNKIGGEISSTENRVLAVFPTLINQDQTINRNFPTELENWINDNVGGRKLSQKIVTYSDYYLFHLSAKTDTYIGKDFWTFYITDDIIKDYQKLNLPDQTYIDSYVVPLVKLNDYLSKKDIAFYGFILPDKKTIYSENYSPNIISQPYTKNKSEIVVETVQAEGLEFFYLKDCLLNAKQPHITLYSPRIDNAHWNTYGAYIGYDYIMEQMSVQFADLQSLKIGENYTVQNIITEGVFNDTIAITEESYIFNELFLNSTQNDLERFDRLPNLTFSYHPEAYKKRTVNPDAPNSQKILIIGDSYSLALWSFMSSTFSEVTYIHIADINYVYDVIDDLEPDIVIFEQVERMFDFSLSAFTNIPSTNE